MSSLGFAYTDTCSDKGGQPAYPPSAMLKLYLYGYSNKTCAERSRSIRPSRMLTRETQRNLEVIWLIPCAEPVELVLSVVEVVNKLIVCTDVVNDDNDTQQLAPMALQAKEVLEVDRLAARSRA